MRSIKSKIKTMSEANEIAKRLRNNHTIVSTNGVFDVLHIGHLESFLQAKQFSNPNHLNAVLYGAGKNSYQEINRTNNFLIVGLNSDDSVRRYKVGRPINTEFERAYLVASLECVDLVTIFPQDDPREFLKGIKPDYHFKSENGYKGIEKGVVESNGGQVVLIPEIPDHSTTITMNKMVKSFLEAEKSQPRAGDGTYQQERYYRKGV